jgi:hypothetical protein
MARGLCLRSASPDDSACRRAILLVAGDKSGTSQQRFYRQLIEKADARYKAHLAKLKLRNEHGSSTQRKDR